MTGKEIVRFFAWAVIGAVVIVVSYFLWRGFWWATWLTDEHNGMKLPLLYKPPLICCAIGWLFVGAIAIIRWTDK